MKIFRVFDATLFSNKPSELPMSKIQSAYSFNLWPTSDRSQLPPEQYIKNYFSSLSFNSPCFIDIEHWPIYSENDGAYREKLLTILRWYREVQSAPVGYYTLAPKRDYWRSLRSKQDSQFVAWQAENDYAHSISANSDILFPSLYTFYDDPSAWELYATRNIEEARRYRGRKKVYPFLWMQYHDSNASLRNQFIDPEKWLNQLYHIYSIADSVVLWGGYQQVWDEQASWWKATQDFIRKHVTSY